MASTAKRNAKPSAKATQPSAARLRARAPIRGSAAAKPAKRPAAPPKTTSTKPKAPARTAPFPLRAVLEQLEPRLLMSADVAPLAADALFATPASPGGAEFRSLAEPVSSSAVTADGLAPIQRTHEVVFVDPRVPDRAQLLAGLTAQADDGRSFEVVVLDPARDGLAQVTAALAGRIQVDAVHFVSHGADGAVQLGATWLDAKTLGANADAVAGWGASLKQDADILFYGCDLAATARGRALVDWIAELTQADVAASTDATGAAQAGGDWELEAKSGSIETEVAVGADARAAWSHALSAAGTGPEARANIPTAPTQEQAAVATAPDGRVVVAWVSDGQDGGGKGVYARLYDASGAAQTVELPVNTTTSNDQVKPAVAMDGSGNFVVVWSGEGTGDGDGVFARRFDAAGTPFGAEFRVNVAVGGKQSSPDIAMEPNGDFAVVWKSDENGVEVWLQRYQANGTPIGGPSLVSVNGGDVDEAPSIAMDDDGDFVVAWESDDGSNEGIFGRRYSNSGAALGAPVLLNATTAGHQERPDVAMDAVGNFVVVWDGEGAGDSTGVYGRRFNDAGTALGGDFRINTNTADEQDNAAVGMAGDGRFVVTWDSKNEDESGGEGVYRQEFTAAGATDGGASSVNTTTNGDQTLSAIAMNDAGGYVTGWSGRGASDTNGVFWRRFAVAATGTISGTVYDDVDGDGNLAGAGVFAGATVRLFRDLGGGAIDALDVLQGAPTLTSAAGAFSFTGLGAGTYFVVVDSRTLGASNVWAEQTYGAEGSALGAGFTTIDGKLFGGRERLGAGTSDGSSLLNPDAAEHVIRVTIGGGGVGGVDFGFSLNAITTARDGDDDGLDANRSIQGSLRQFIQNANATAGVQSANFSIGGGGLHTITRAAGQPGLAITDPVVLDAGTQEGYAGTPLIELDGALSGGVVGLTLGGTGGSTIRGFVINRFSGGGIVTNSTGNQILSNWIGTSNTGAGGAGNTGDGVSLRSNNNLVSGNVISGNSGDGIEIEAGRSGNRITANYIGTNATGTAALANSGNAGVYVSGNANTIGGSAGGEGNLISGNGGFAGIWLSGAQATGNVVQGNLIGTNAAGTLPIGNISGVLISGGATGNQIGGTGLNAGNMIAFNNQDGVQVSGATTTGNAISGNAFRENTQQGIDLVGGTGETLAGVTPNDGAGDPDPGPNGYQNYPQLLAAGISGGNLNVRFNFASTGGRNFRIELFASSAPDTNGFGEGQRYLGSTVISTDGGGLATSTGITITAGVAAGEFITATATDLTSNDTSTSEFSNAVVAGDRVISGTVYNDANADATVSIAEGTFAGAQVTLYVDDGDGVIDGGDLVAGSTFTSAAGTYVFAGLGNATYWVVVDSRTLDAGGYLVGGVNDVWAEQTYGTLGAVSFNGSYSYAAGPSAFYGGMEATGTSSSDNATSITTAEHVTRVLLGGTNATGVDSGFSFSAVTSARDGDDDAGNPNRSIQGSLRQFIQNSNAIFGLQTVNFEIGPTGAPQTINVTGSALPTITDAVVLNAWTQGTVAYSGPPLIELDGSAAGAGAHGLTITAGGSTVRGFVINDFAGRGVYITGGGGNTIAGNYIGTDSAGNLDRGNGLSGVVIENSANNVVGGLNAADRNLISGSQLDGITIGGAGSTGNLVQGNTIGLNAAGAAALGNGESGIDIGGGASNNTVGGAVAAARNVISGNAWTGIDVSGTGTTGNVVLGNYIGTDAGGTLDRGNLAEGVYVFGGATSTVIGGSAPGAGNLISGNNSAGVWIDTSGTTVQGNRVGTNAAGTAALRNELSGVVVSGGGNTIGGTAAGAGNLLSGNGENGLLFSGAGATGNVVLGNVMGLNAAGNAMLGNELSGVMLLNGAGGNTIGGTVAGARNVLSGNDQDGITGFASNGNLIQGNYIGTDAGGTVDRGNAEDGVYFQDSSNNLVGGTAVGAGNVLSGNNWTGITFYRTGSGNVVQGNRVGTDASGTLDLGNTRAGVWIATSGAATVGGAAPGAGNLIAYSNWDGVMLTEGTGHAVLGNTIHSNTEESIDIDDGLLPAYEGIQPNDYDATPSTAPYTHDDDGGVNQHQNFPVLTSAVTTGTQISIVGTLRSTENTSFRVEFFANAAADGEAGRYLGYANVSTDATGVAFVGATFGGSLAAGERVSATATRADATFTSFFETSEVGATVVATTARSISGMTRYDVNGNGLADDGVAFFTGGTVRLYLDDGDDVIDAGDVLTATATVQADGTYTFGGLADATYYVAIDSKTLLFPASAIWAEQTYGVAGAASGAGFLGTPGTLLGGRAAMMSDDASALTTSEHVTRVVLAGADATGIDAGFALNAITSNRDGDDDGAASGRTVQGSLRQFIQNSNAIGGTQTAEFSIGGGGFRSITLASALPVIADAVILDARTQDGFAGTPLIELNGAGVATLNDGLQISASGVTVRGFIINRFLGDGIHLDGSNSVIAGNWIGLDSTGNAAPGNASWGIHVLGANNTIGGTGPSDRNVIAGNSLDGVQIVGAGATGNLVQGNYIGTDRTGTIDLGNAGDGISIQGGAGGNLIGGSVTAARNVIAGNNDDGIEIAGSSSGNVIVGNYIGLNAGGAVALGNSQQGIDVSGSNNTIGGTGPNDRNLISGNSSHGIMLTGGATGNRVLGNYIGTDLTGTLDRGNADGIRIESGANGNTIGGTSNLDRNVISGNEDGIEISGAGTSGNVILGNYIGTTANGAGALGNSESGVEVTAPNNTIGGTTSGAGNTIAFSGQDGVMVNGATTTGALILGNVIHSNGGTGIDLADNGPTANDPGDTDPGANNLQNFPVLSGAAINGTTVTIAGSLDSAASTNYRIEFFANGVGGPRYLGALSPDLFIGVAGTATFSATLTPVVAVVAGETITATATNLTTLSTSELSAAVTAAAGVSISGTLFHDVNGNANITDDGAGAFFANVTSAVALYLDDGDGIIDSGDSFVAAVNTNASGLYTFNGLASGTYYVGVNSKALAGDPVWAEQTYAVIGAANSAAGTTFTTAVGALYGGRSASASDNALGSINTAEHVTKVMLVGANVDDINSGFSFTAITSSRDGDDDASGRTVQGSLRQFIQNANVMTGTQTANFSIAGAGVRTINVASALPTITEAVILDAAATQEGFGGTPIVELNGTSAGAGASGLTIAGGGSTVRGFVINRFGQDGINVSGGTGNTIAGNYIGTNAAGTVGQGNGRYGIELASGSNVVGGFGPADRNVISGNNVDGVHVFNSSGNIIRGNYIGTDRTGTFAIGNTEDGIWLDGASNTLIGGTPAGAENLLSGNGWSGIAFSNGGSLNMVHGNLIGVNATNTLPLANGRHGIDVDGSSGATIGGLAPGQANVIANNAWDGVSITSGTGHTVSGNSIHSSVGLGIDINDDDVTTNDALDGLGGPNNEQNFPVLTSVTTSSVTGTVNSAPFRTLRIEVFASAAADPLGHGEGQRYLNSTTVTTDGTGFASFTIAITAALGEWVSATATGTTSGDTSEFGAAMMVDAAPVNNVPAGPLSASEDAPLAIGTISVSDPQNNVTQVALSVLNGMLTVVPGGTALVAGVGTSNVVILGNQNDINLTLASLVYQGNLHYNGPETLTVTSTDSGGLQDTDAVAITVNPVNDAPANGVPGFITVTEDVASAITGLSIADVDVGAGALVVTLSVPSGTLAATTSGGVAVAGSGTGTLTLAGTLTDLNAFLAVPSVTFTTAPGATAPVTLTVVTNDQGNTGAGGPLNDSDTITLNVTAVNDAPAGTNTAVFTAEDTAYTFVPGDFGFTDPGDIPANAFLAVRIASLPAAGSLFHTVNGPVGIGTVVSAADIAAGLLRFTPTANANGAGYASFTFQVQDDGGTGSGGVDLDPTPNTTTINVTPANDPPQALNDLAIVVENSGANTINVLANDSILPDTGETLTITGVTQGANGSVAIVGGTTVTYTPNASFFGPDSFSYTIDDGNGGTATATVNVTVTPANDPPVANDDAAIVAEDSGATTISVLANDSILPDVGETLTITGVTQGTNGSVAIVGGTTVTYAPNADFYGADSFTYTIDDGNGGTATATVNVTVTPVNDAPAANDDAAATNQDTPVTTGDVLANDTLGDQATVIFAFTPVSVQGGTVALNAGNTFIYTPATGFSGTDTFTYIIRDADGETSTATVTVTVANVANDPPVNTVPGAQISAEDTPLVFSLGTGNRISVSDPDAGANPLEVTLTSTNGTLTLAGTAGLTFTAGDGTADATMTFTGTATDIDAALDGMSFLPTLDYDGPATVTITTNDLGATGAGGGLVDSDLATIDVLAVNDAPTAVGEAYVTDEELPLAVAAAGVLGNDWDVDGTPVTAAIVTGPANGSVAFNADGSFVYTPNANFTGVDSFTYQVSDGALLSGAATVTITVNPINDAPTAADGNVVVAAAYAFAAADFNYFDVDGDPLDRIRITALPAEGQLLFNGLAVALNQEVTAADLAAGLLTYAPPTTSALSAVTFGFSVSDGTLYEGASHTMTIGFAAGAVPPPPAPPAPPAPPPVVTPPAEPPPAPAPADAAPAEPTGDAAAGGGRGGGGGGAPAGPPTAESAPTVQAETTQAAAGVVATAAPPVAGAGQTGSIGFQSGGVAANPGVAAPATPVETRGEPLTGEVKAEMETVAAMAAPEVRQALDEARERAQEDMKIEARVAGSVFVVSTGLSVGYVLWLLRGGALIASLLSSLPAWRLVDPLPVLGSMGGRAGEEDDDSLEDLVADDREAPDAPGADELADNDNVGSVRT